ncbi:Vacuolar protein sorting-associated protein 54, variant 2, partial [Perkinsus olseni]
MSSEPEPGQQPNFVARDGKRRTKPPPPPPRRKKLPGVTSRRSSGSKSDGAEDTTAEANPDFSALLEELRCTQSLSSLVNAPTDIEIAPEGGGSEAASGTQSIGGNLLAVLGASGKSVAAGQAGQASLYSAPTPAAYATASGTLSAESSQMIRPLLDLPPSEALAMLPPLEPTEGVSFDQYLSTLAPGFTGTTTKKEEGDNDSPGLKRRSPSSSSSSSGGVHLKGVPDVYFHEDYDIAQSSVFAGRSLRSLMTKQDELNSQLAQQLDTVEVHLASKLSNFDELLGSLRDLGSIQADIVQARSTVGTCRGSVKELQSGCLQPDFQLARCLRRRARLNKICRLLMGMRTVEEVYTNLSGVIQNGEFLDALDLIEKVRRLLQDELGGIAAVRSIRKSLDDNIKVIDKNIESEFIDVCSAGVVVVLDSSKITIPEARQNLADRLSREKVLEAMSRRHLLSSTIQTDLRDTLLTRARRLVKKIAQLSSARLIQESRAAVNGVSSSEDARGGGGTTTDGAGDLKPATSRRSTTGRLERALGQLNSEQLLTLWSELMGAAVEVARGLQWLDQQLTQYYTPDDDNVAASKDRDGIDLRGQVQRVAAAVMQAVLVRCGQVLQLRQNRNSLMSPEDLGKMISITNTALSEKVAPCFDSWTNRTTDGQKSADVTGVPGGANLSAIVLQQAKLAVEEIHQANVAQANLLLEREKWERTDVPAHFESRVLSKFLPEGHEVEDGSSSGEDQKQQGKDSTGRGRRYLVLPEDQGSFLVVPAGLGILELIAVYLDVARALPQLATDAAVRLTSMLRLANGQIEKLLLEGQAVSSGSRKTVTATNLALTY